MSTTKIRAKEVKTFIGDRTVMVVDPSANMRDSIKRFLLNIGIKNIKLAGSADEAKRELINAKVGLFIVEWILPDQNGLEFCRSIRQRKSFEKVPFLLTTGENLRSDVMLASEAGITSYLLKPFAYDDFCTQIATIVRGIENPSPLDELIESGEQFLRQQAFDKAEECFQKALKEKKNSARALAGIGKIFLWKQDTQSAITYFEQALLANAKYLEGYNLLLETYEKHPNLEKQQRTAEQAHALSPDNPKYTLVLARIYFEQSSIDRAEEFFKKTISLSPKLAEAYRGLGHVHLEKNEVDKAIKSFKKALDLAPENISLLNALGLSYVKKGLIMQGINYYKIGLNMDAKDWRILFNMAFAHEKLGDIAEASHYYERTLAANPEFEKAQRRLDHIKLTGKPGDTKDSAKDQT